MKISLRPWTLLFALFLSAVCAFAQSDRGSITGIVTDPSGAAVVGAKVTVTNTSTGESRTSVTNAEGNYNFPELQAAVYQVVVESPNFKKATTNNVKVDVQTVRRVDARLTIGDVQQDVTVTAEASQIQRENAADQTSVTERQVRELPLAVGSETAGRTPLAFIFLDSSVTSGSTSSGSGRGTDASTFKVSGSQALGTEILIDGATTRRAQNGTFFSEVAPGPNAFQEFTLSSNSYSAEFGSSSGGVVNFTLKSGGNKFHGEGYELYKNEFLNANSYEHLTVSPHIGKDKDRENDFGGNIGGPIIIPGLYHGHDKAFFFFNFEGYRFNQTETVDLTVPTAKMRTGDFSELLTDPYVVQTLGGPVQIFDPTVPCCGPGRPIIPGNRLDTYINGVTGKSVIDPAGLAIISHFPMPTTGGVFHNYHVTSTAPLNMDNYVGKTDFVLTEKQHLSLSYSWRGQNTIQGGFPRNSPPIFRTDVWQQDFTSHFARLQHDYTLTPMLLNHFNFGINRVVVANHNAAAGIITPSSLGIPANATQNVAFPYIDFPGYGDPVTSPDPQAYQPWGSTFFSDYQADNTVEISDSVTWSKGNHTLKFGTDLRNQRLNVAQFTDPGGHFNFRSDQTSNGGPRQGWPIASLITGATEFSFDTIHSVSPEWRYIYPSFYANDDWKLTPRLNLNLGVRYEIPYPRTEAQNRFRTFDPTATNPITATKGALVGAAGQGGKAKYKGLVAPDYSDVAVRLGAAYSLNNKTVLRGGYGIFYSPIIYGFNGANSITEGTLGYSTSRLITPNGATSTAFLSTYPAAPAVDPNGQFLGSDVEYFNPDYKVGRTQQYSVDIQRELPWNFALQVGYVGHKGDRLRSNFLRLNALPFQDLKLGFPLLTKDINAVTASDRAYASSLGITLPANANAVFPGFAGNVAQALKPFPQYGRINNQLESLGTDSYNALEVKLNKRFSGGLQYGMSFTWSHEITDASETLFGGSPFDGNIQNPFDRKHLRQTSPGDVPLAFVFNYIYELPFGKNKKYMNHGGPSDVLFGGWQVSGINRYQSGTPLVVFNNASVYSADFLDLVGYQGGVRPNLTGAPILLGIPSSASNFQIINPAAFASPQVYRFAPAGSTIGDAAYAAYYADPTQFFGTAPGVLSNVRLNPYYSENLSLIKKTALTETWTLELRAEVFNLFNRHRFFNPDANINFNPPDNSTLGGVGPNFGRETVIRQSDASHPYNPRQVQLGLRVIF